MKTNAIVCISMFCMALGPMCLAEPEDGPTEPTGQNTQPAAAENPADRAQLTTRVVDFAGSVRVREATDQPWQAVEKGMVLPVGAEVQTGLRGELTLDIGPNARVTVERLSHFYVGRLARDGNVLRTLVAVKHGRIDFKVNRVGFNNDFRIASPTGTMAVKGTGGKFTAGLNNAYDPDKTNETGSAELNSNSDGGTYIFDNQGTEDNGGRAGQGIFGQGGDTGDKRDDGGKDSGSGEDPGNDAPGSSSGGLGGGSFTGGIEDGRNVLDGNENNSKSGFENSTTPPPPIDDSGADA